ncbi:TIGR03016 family PEP-CTERM system-associated outer membrane protein [Halochromatium glycolicum]|uniref:TIGR03016 family PEP-CTERM system-associated outer membrane protein n=1 Tax=Halochromatium glycolicum TaxID=85075 RepID=UPI00190CA35E|nr:TIGR03016 family PEP-CTERM system-associated outer membrane protein [Halochromatium glycolicum]
MFYGLGVVLTAAGSFAFAVDTSWDFTPRLSLSQVFSDNIRLEPRGDEESDLITQLNTGFNFNREGAQARASVGYNLQSLFYWRETGETSFFHQFFADSGIEVVEDRLAIDAAAGFSQRQLVRERAGGDNLNLDGNRGDVLTFRISPIYTEQFDDFADFQLRYSYNRVDVQSSEVSGSNSQRNEVSLNLTSGALFSRLGWGLSADWSETDFDDGASTSLASIEALARWNATDRFSVFGTIGYEQDDFDQEEGNPQQDDITWQIGATFAAGERTFMEAFVGDRVFGRSYGASLRHRLRNSRVFLDYSEDITTVNEFEIDQTIPRGVSSTVEEAVIVDGEPVFLDLESPELRSGAFVSRRLSAGYSGQRRKTGWGLRVFHEEREFEVSDRSEQAQSIVGNVSWRMAPRTSLIASGSIQENSFADQEGEQTLYSTRLGLQRQLGPRLSASLDYSYRDLDSSANQDGYQENRVTATLQKSF